MFASCVMLYDPIKTSLEIGLQENTSDAFYDIWHGDWGQSLLPALQRVPQVLIQIILTSRDQYNSTFCQIVKQEVRSNSGGHVAGPRPHSDMRPGRSALPCMSPPPKWGSVVYTERRHSHTDAENEIILFLIGTVIHCNSAHWPTAASFSATGGQGAICMAYSSSLLFIWHHRP